MILINFGEWGGNINSFCSEIFKTLLQIAEDTKEEYEMKINN